LFGTRDWIPPCGRNDAWVAGRGTKGTGFAVGDRAFYSQGLDSIASLCETWRQMAWRIGAFFA